MIQSPFQQWAHHALIDGEHRLNNLSRLVDGRRYTSLEVEVASQAYAAATERALRCIQMALGRTPSVDAAAVAEQAKRFIMADLDSLYFIASIKHTRKESEHILFWGWDRKGYTQVIGPSIGEYAREEAVRLNDHEDTLAVPIQSVWLIASPEPYDEKKRRYYDQCGPVISNTEANWTLLRHCAIPKGTQC